MFDILQYPAWLIGVVTDDERQAWAWLAELYADNIHKNRVYERWSDKMRAWYVY